MATVAQVVQQHELIGNLVGREVRSRYKQSVLGMSWSLVTPLVNTILYTFIFQGLAGLTSGTNAKGQVIPYALFVYTGTMFWNFFAAGLTAGADSLTSNLQLLTKVYFPREVFVLAALATRVVDFALSFTILVILTLFFWIVGQKDGHGTVQHFTLSWLVLLTPLILLIQVMLMLGLSFLLATANLFYRDVRYIVVLIVQVWVFATPVAYPVAVFLRRFHKHPDLLWVFQHLNPMTPLILAYQDLILRGRMPDWSLVAYAAVIGVSALVIGYVVFMKYEADFAEAV